MAGSGGGAGLDGAVEVFAGSISYHVAKISQPSNKEQLIGKVGETGDPQFPQPPPKRPPLPMQIKHTSIHTPRMHHPQRLQVVIERVADEDGAGVDVGVESVADGGEGEEGGGVVGLGGDAGEAGVEVSVGCSFKLER